MLRNPSTTPPLHPNNIGLRQDSHSASLPPNRPKMLRRPLESAPAQWGQINLSFSDHPLPNSQSGWTTLAAAPV
jgi:hypothetical protein